jgi:hypothetical protein
MHDLADVSVDLDRASVPSLYLALAQLASTQTGPGWTRSTRIEFAEPQDFGVWLELLRG